MNVMKTTNGPCTAPMSLPSPTLTTIFNHAVPQKSCSTPRWYKLRHHAGLKIQLLNIAKNFNRGKKKTDSTDGTDAGTLSLSSVRRLIQNKKISR